MKDSEQVALTLHLPQAVVKQIKDRAHHDDTTLRSVVLSALREAGYEVAEADLRDRRSARGSGR